MKKRIMAMVLTLMMSLGVCATSFAVEAGGVVGFVNMQVILNSYPGIKDIAKQIADKQNAMQKEFNEQSQNLDDKGKAELQAKLNQELGKFESSKMAPVQKTINKTILKVAEAKGIQSVVNAGAMVAGGKDLTSEVVKELKSKE